MSRVGVKPVPVPAGVKVDVAGQVFKAKGAKGEAKAKPAKAKKEKAPKPEKVAKEKAPKKPSKKKVAKEARMKAFWGVFNQGMKKLVTFEYADKRAAEKKASELGPNHFVQLVKEAITE